MKILSFDTTAATATAAITENEKLTAQTVLNTPNTHSVTLLPMIDFLLKSSGIRLDDIGLIATVVGPGSFTGVRIGVATAKGLAVKGSTPCIGISAPEALAYNVADVKCGIVCPVMDARRGQLYNALFAKKGDSLKRLTEDRVITAAELSEELKKYSSDDIYLPGDGADVACRALSGDNIHRCGELTAYHSAYSAAKLAFMKYVEAGEEEKAGFTAEKLSPVYLRVCQAERERLEKLKAEEKGAVK